MANVKPDVGLILKARDPGGGNLNCLRGRIFSEGTSLFSLIFRFPNTSFSKSPRIFTPPVSAKPALPPKFIGLSTQISRAMLNQIALLINLDLNHTKTTRTKLYL
jgi:hypothetical protein